MARIRTGTWRFVSEGYFEREHGIVKRVRKSKGSWRWMAYLKVIAPIQGAKKIYAYFAFEIGAKNGYTKSRDAMMAVEKNALDFAAYVIKNNPDLFFIYKATGRIKNALSQPGDNELSGKYADTLYRLAGYGAGNGMVNPKNQTIELIKTASAEEIKALRKQKGLPDETEEIMLVQEDEQSPTSQGQEMAAVG